MDDYFSLLGVARRPCLSQEELKERFFELSSRSHPDRFHNSPADKREAVTEEYARLNRAYQCLSEVKARLHHLIQLETGEAPTVVQQSPEEAMNLFLEVGQLCHKLDQFLAEKAKLTSPLLKARHFEKGIEWANRVKELQTAVHSRQAEALEELQGLDRHWEEAPPPGSPGRLEALPMQQLEALYRRYSYLNRWAQQLQERLFQLTT